LQIEDFRFQISDVIGKSISNLKSAISNAASFNEGAMRTETSDRQELLVWTMLSIVGAILAIVGWYRWAV